MDVEQNGIGGHWIKIFLSAPHCNSLSMGLFIYRTIITHFGTNVFFHFWPKIQSLFSFCSRAYEKKYGELMSMQQENIFVQTGCQKPCHFNKYSFSGDKQAILNIVSYRKHISILRKLFRNCFVFRRPRLNLPMMISFSPSWLSPTTPLLKLSI